MGGGEVKSLGTAGRLELEFNTGFMLPGASREPSVTRPDGSPDSSWCVRCSIRSFGFRILLVASEFDLLFWVADVKTILRRRLGRMGMNTGMRSIVDGQMQ